MAAYCLPRDLAAKFKKELQEGRIDPDHLAGLSSAARRAFFEPIVGKENAQHVNALFESKLLLKDQQAGLVRWAKSLTGIKAKTRTDMLAKIAKMDKILTPSDEHGFLADLAEQKLGTAVTEEEAAKVMEMSQAAIKARDNPGSNMSGVSDDYLKASAEMHHYVESLKPTTALKSIGENLLVIGRNHMLMNPSTPIKTTTSQILNSAIEAATRRISARAVSGQSGDLATLANKEAWATFRATGRNTASMESMDDSGTLGERKWFKEADGISGAGGLTKAMESGVRKYAELTNKIAIDWEHNIAFTKFYQKAFFDGLNIGATNIAKSESAQPGRNHGPLTGADLKERADEIFKDAARIEPKTDAGVTLRAQAQKQAARVTSTNETWLSNISMAIKNGLNEKVPGLGDILMPIAKIPATVIANGIENAGPGLPHGVYDMFKGREKMASDDEKTRYEGAAQFARGYQRIARTVGTLAFAAFAASLLNKKDFRSDNYGNQFVRIGGVWVNMEYISAISPALAAMMTVKKDGRPSDGIGATTGHYVSGAAQALRHAPGVDDLPQLVNAVANKDVWGGIEKYLKNFAHSRALPAAAWNVSKDRPVNRLLFGATGIETPQDVTRDNMEKARTRAANRRANQ